MGIYLSSFKPDNIPKVTNANPSREYKILAPVLVRILTKNRTFPVSMNQLKSMTAQKIVRSPIKINTMLATGMMPSPKD